MILGSVSTFLYYLYEEKIFVNIKFYTNILFIKKKVLYNINITSH